MKKASDKIEREIIAYNAAQAARAVEEFEQGETADYFRENAGYVTGLVVTRLKAIEQGKPPFPLRPYDAETLARLMAAQTDAVYDAKGFDGEEVRDGYTTSADTPTAEKQRKLRDALVAYARAAASYAKRIGSASLLSWAEIIDILENRSSAFFPYIGKADALRLIELEKPAADRLRLDKIVAELPASKPAKKAKR